METAQTAHVAPDSGRRRRRVIPIIDSRFQWKYTLLITALGVGVTAVMGGLLYKAHQDNTRLLKLDPGLLEQVTRGDQIFLLYLIITVIAMAVVLSVWGLIVTHRISGPLYLVARYLDVLADGQYPDVRPLRKRDELQEFFAAFEEAVNALRNRDAEALRELEAALATDKPADAVNAVKKYRAVLANSLGQGGVNVE
jgi:hypothetical protein